jgi:hypothetical protein
MSIPQDREEQGKTSRYESGGRASYDQTAVLAALRPEGAYFANERGRLSVEKDGTNRWEVVSDGPHVRLVEKMEAKALAGVIEDLMMPVTK